VAQSVPSVPICNVLLSLVLLAAACKTHCSQTPVPRLGPDYVGMCCNTRAQLAQCGLQPLCAQVLVGSLQESYHRFQLALSCRLARCAAEPCITGTTGGPQQL